MQADRSQLTALPAIRCALGFGLPLALGVMTGHVIEGVSIAGGALGMGTVGLASIYRMRARMMLLACAGIALSAFVGSVTSSIDWLAIVAVGVWGIGVGLLVALGPAAMTIGLRSAVALIILSHFALDPAHAALQALLMLAGALFQTGLALLPVPWLGTAPERSALSTVYQTLADYAANPADMQRASQITNALSKTYNLLIHLNTSSRQGMVFFGLFQEAERLRMSILLLRKLRKELIGEMPENVSGIEHMDQILQAAAEQLQEIANELTLMRSFRNRRTPPQQRIKLALEALHHAELSGETIQHVPAVGNQLRDQLHTARKLSISWRYPQKLRIIHLNVPLPSKLRMYDAWHTLRANMTLRSTAFRHAIRLGLALALTTALYRITPLPVEHGYWLPFTALLVLRPDFKTTFSRGLARALGTILGAGLTTLLVAVLLPSQGLLVIISAFAAYLAYSVLYYNYALFSAFITVVIVFLLTFITPQPAITALYRALDTAIGSILSLLIYILWPTWEIKQVPANIAKRLERVRIYVVAVLQLYAHLDAYDELAMHNYRMEARLARSNAGASIERSLHEPQSHRVDSDLAQGLFGAINTIMQCALVLEAYILDHQVHTALPEMSDLAQKVDEALSLLTNAIRQEQKVASLPDLQSALRSLQHSGKLASRAQENVDLNLVLAEVKQIVDNIDAMRRLLSLRAWKDA